MKVFAVREDGDCASPSAMPMVAGGWSLARPAYFRRKEEILAALSHRFRDVPFAIDWRLDDLDAPGQGSDGVYLTVTGISAEDADSGQVGRGDSGERRIAFSRPTGGEAAAGKNPVAHTGKVYSVLATGWPSSSTPARRELLEVQVHLGPHRRAGRCPWTGVQVILPDGGALADVEAPFRQVVEAEDRAAARVPIGADPRPPPGVLRRRLQAGRCRPTRDVPAPPSGASARLRALWRSRRCHVALCA